MEARRLPIERVDGGAGGDLAELLERARLPPAKLVLGRVDYGLHREQDDAGNVTGFVLEMMHPGLPIAIQIPFDRASALDLIAKLRTVLDLDP